MWSQVQRLGVRWYHCRKKGRGLKPINKEGEGIETIVSSHPRPPNLPRGDAAQQMSSLQDFRKLQAFLLNVEPCRKRVFWCANTWACLFIWHCRETKVKSRGGTRMTYMERKIGEDTHLFVHTKAFLVESLLEFLTRLTLWVACSFFSFGSGICKRNRVVSFYPLWHCC